MKTIILLSFLLICSLIFSVYGHAEHPLLLLISFDGFRWDYLHKVNCLKGKHTPNFDKLMQNGVFVNEGVKNAYITKTFPNHYTIVTGLYEESHGVVDNQMLDLETNLTFTIANSNDTSNPYWFDNGEVKYDGYPEPIWLSNEKAGNGRKSGVMFWPGSEAKGMTASRYMRYNASLPNKTRIDNVVEWFTTEDDPINLGLLYFSEPDHTGHQVGPDSEVMVDMIIALDSVVGYLLDRLKETNLLDRLNIILTSDHGMAQVENLIQMDKFVNASLYKHVSSGGPVWNILPVKGKEDELLEQLRKVKNLKTNMKEDIPVEYHYRHKTRTMPVVIEAAEHFLICPDGSCTGKGTHGYDNGLSSMHPIFIAHGPAFKKNYTSSQFNNVDIYPLMCHILGVKPAVNNGSFDNIKQVLYIEEGFTLTSITMMLSISFCALVSGVCCISVSRLFMYRRTVRPTKSYQINRLGVLESTALKSQHASLLSSEEEEFA